MGFVITLCVGTDQLLRVVRPECSANARNSATLPSFEEVQFAQGCEWASWVDALAMIKQRHPEVSHRGQLEGNPTTPNLRALTDTTRI